MSKKNRTHYFITRAVMLGIIVTTASACDKKANGLRVTQPTVYELKTNAVVRVGEILHSNRVEVNGTDTLVTHEIELGGVHSGYGAVTVVNVIYRKIDSKGNNITRPKVISHKLSDGTVINVAGAEIEIQEIKTDYVRYSVKRDFDEVLNR